MVSASLQIQNTGKQDIYLTANPEIDVFMYKYYRHVNFATEIHRFIPNDIIDFGKSCVFTVPKVGHLLSKLYLRIQVPALTKTSGSYLSWTDTLGYSIFRGGIDLEVGGLVIDTIYPIYNDIADSLKRPDNDLGANLPILRGDTYVSSKFNATKSNDLLIPLNFWFTKDYSLALPIVSIPSQELKIRMKFRSFQECINYDGDAPLIEAAIESAELIAEYIFMDDSVLHKFNDRKVYLIEQVRYNGDETILQNAGTFSTRLEFTNPLKELVFAVAEVTSVENNDYLNFSMLLDNTNLVSEIGLFLDGVPRVDYLPEIMNRLGYSLSLHSSVPLKYVYTLPFCTRPEAHTQPTGSLNVSMYDNAILSLRMVKNNPRCFVYVFGVVYKILVIENGIMTMEFI